MGNGDIQKKDVWRGRARKIVYLSKGGRDFQRGMCHAWVEMIKIRQENNAWIK